MGQVLHIFKKDARYLWREICLVLVLAAIFILTNPWWLATLMLAAASYLIARLIHAEAIPGDRQFWITRPYRSRNLLGAKLLFIVVFVNLPILVAQLLVVAASGFPLSSSVPGLLWSQALIVLISSIPMIALAAMTPGTVPFIFSILILATLWFGAYTTIWVSPKVRQPFWPSAVEWIRDTITVMVLAAIVFCILYVQYRRRRTFLSRTIALVGVAFMAFVHWCLPWPPAWSLQSRLSKQSFDRSSVQVSSDSNSIRFSPRHQRTWENVEVYIPIVVRFVPDELEVKIDALVVTFEAPDGRTWTSTVGGAKRRSGGLGVTVIESTTTMDHSFFNRELEKVVTLRGSLYLTLFGNDTRATTKWRPAAPG